jgi:hypothetical protein
MPGERNAGRWGVGNAKFTVDATESIPLINFDPTKIDDPADQRASNSYTIGNLFRVGDRDIQVTELGLHDADGGTFKGGKVGVWATTAVRPAAGIDEPELAAWMLIASTVLNLDETIVRD